MSARLTMQRAALVALSCLAGFAMTATAQPDLTIHTGVTVADTGVPGWRFEQIRLSSADGERHYRVRVALPESAAPARGFASVWLLDGNAALMETSAALWGHSYGGVFVLHALFTRPQFFSTFAAADPSLWWGDGHLLRAETSAAALPTPPPRLHLWVGQGAVTQRAPTAAPPTRDPARVDAMRKARGSVPPDATARMAERLRERGVEVQFDTLQGLSHGQTLGASLRQLLLDRAQEHHSP